MANVDAGYTTIPVHKDALTEARVTKAKLNLTWNEYIERAAEELDPGDDY